VIQRSFERSSGYAAKKACSASRLLAAALVSVEEHASELVQYENPTPAGDSSHTLFVLLFHV
jgi:hypothetical protein